MAKMARISANILSGGSHLSEPDDPEEHHPPRSLPFTA
jgi:hypothetical protein